MPTVTITVSDEADSTSVRGTPIPVDESKRSPAEQLAAAMQHMAAEIGRALGGETHALDENGERIKPVELQPSPILLPVYR